jgi:LysM repeat protein
MSDAAISDPYRVKSGDTLSDIAKQCGRSMGDLKRFNKLANPNRLEVGQTLYLSEQTAFGVTVLFLDALRHPIENLAYQLQFDGQTAQGTTGAAGTTPRQITKDAKSAIEVWMRNLEGQWQQVGAAVSGYGHKLLTAVSPYLIVPGETERHPSGAPLKPEAPATPKPAPVPQGAQAPAPKPASGTPTKNNPPVKTQPTKGPQGQPVLKIEIDIPQGLVELFNNYKGGEITEQDWKTKAKDLECEVEVLKSIAQVESGGRNSFWRLNSRTDAATVPAIMYERHYFSRLTKGKYDKDHPDISWPTGYRKRDQLGKADQKMSDGKVEQTDIYSDYATSYLRLINAFRLDEEAALKSCSWGKFQVMGDNAKLCGATNARDLVAGMCTSELNQIEFLVAFIQKKPQAWKDAKNKTLGKEISLWDAVKTKDWKAIAFNYNGPGYKTYDYDTKLKKAYEQFKKA